jgi:hypothetical protein
VKKNNEPFALNLARSAYIVVFVCLEAVWSELILFGSSRYHP